MNGKLAKKLRKYTKKQGKEYLKELKSWSFVERWRFAWWLLFGDKKMVE